MARKRNRGKAKVVDFFAGIKTPSKADDRRVRFVAREKLKDPTAVPKGMFDGLPKGFLEEGGFKFDRNFGLGSGNVFKQKIGIDPKFGKKSFDVDFSSEFSRADFVNQPSAIDPVEDDPLTDLDMEDQFQEETEDEVPKLLDSIPKVDRVAKLPKEKELTKSQKLDLKFRRVRTEALETGANPLTPEEKRNFESSTKFTRNFGTTAKKPTGLGLERF